MYYRALLEAETLIDSSLKMILRKPDNPFSGHLKVGIFSQWSPIQFGEPFFESFFTEFPEISVDIESHSFGEMNRLLSEKKLDAIITCARECEHIRKDVRASMFALCEYRYIISSQHPLVIKDTFEKNRKNLPFYVIDEEYRLNFDEKALKRIQLENSEIIGVRTVDDMLINIEAMRGYAAVLSCSRCITLPTIQSYSAGSSDMLLLISLTENSNPAITFFENHVCKINGNRNAYNR